MQSWYWLRCDFTLLEKENEDSIVTGGTDSDECSDETVRGIEESGSNGGGGGGGDNDDEGNIVQATKQIARPNQIAIMQTYRAM